MSIFYRISQIYVQDSVISITDVAMVNYRTILTILSNSRQLCYTYDPYYMFDPEHNT